MSRKIIIYSDNTVIVDGETVSWKKADFDIYNVPIKRASQHIIDHENGIKFGEDIVAFPTTPRVRGKKRWYHKK